MNLFAPMKGNPTPMNRQNIFGPRAVFLILAAALVVAFGLAMALPLFSKTSAKVYVSHPRLFPVYYQTNMDGPGELISSLGFPYAFREFSLRVNRPLVPGLVAFGREAVARPLVLAHLPAKWRAVQWGRWSAVDTLATYFIWLFFNCVFLALAVWLFYRTLREWIGQETGIYAAIILLFTPIVILSLREIQYGCLEILILSASISFWAEAVQGKQRAGRMTFFSLLIGVLFLGKLSISTFAAGAFLYGVFKRKPDVVAYVALTAVPTLLWIGICRMLGIPYHFAEVSGYDGVVWVAKVNSSLELGWEILLYASGWIHVLWESTASLHLLLACAGVWCLIRERHLTMLAMVPCFALADFAFYLLVHRLHAVYGLHTMVILFALAAKGLHGFLSQAGLSGRTAMLAGLLALAIVQAWMNLNQLPFYGG